MNALLTGRLLREQKTVEAMIRLYCRANHGAVHLCAECAGLLEYAGQRLRRCPYGQQKPTCLHCVIHCYRPEMKERIRKVMRYAGPRIMFRHPLLAMRHLIDERLKAGSCDQAPPGRDANCQHR
jgi:hypothetical protein